MNETMNNNPNDREYSFSRFEILFVTYNYVKTLDYILVKKGTNVCASIFHKLNDFTRNKNIVELHSIKSCQKTPL